MPLVSPSSCPLDSVVALASRLVATPSCCGIDAPGPVLKLARDWLADNDLKPRLLGAAAVMVDIPGAAPGPTLCLDACIDTAPAGDPAQWNEAPFSGTVHDGKLWGRGAGDSKAGVAILCHVARHFHERPPACGTLQVLFDADEHTGRFGGVRACLDAIGKPPDAVSLGYPGNDCLVAGSRGFLRSVVRFSGKAAHSGDPARRGVNALTKAASFALGLAEARLPDPNDAAFPFGPSATLTHLDGGQGFSIVPDLATCHVDIRLTRTFDGDTARHWLEAIVRSVDGEARIEPVDHWPAYLVAHDHPLVRSFTAAAETAFGRKMPAEVSGPSNIGNLLAARGVPTICAPGVTFGDMHAANEWSEIASFAPVYAMYCQAARRFLSPDTSAASASP